MTKFRSDVQRVLTPLQYELSRHYAAGMTIAGAAERVGTSINTASKLIQRVRKRLDAPTRVQLAVALQTAIVQAWNGGGRPSRNGFVQGERLRIVDGRFRGRDARYVGCGNSTQVRVQINGGTFVVRKWFVERLA